MRSDSVARTLCPQQNLYSVMSEDAGSHSLRVVGVLCDVLVAPLQMDTVIAAIANPATQIITLTITEQGYLLAADGKSLDMSSAAVVRDLAHPEQPLSAIGLLALGLYRRFQQSRAALTVISCDNLGENSARLRSVLDDYLAASFPEVGSWMAEFVAFPCSMVDRIVPASNEAQLQRQGQLLGLRDEAAVCTEPFRQWIIENKFATPVPAWQAVGVQLVDDVRPYEAVKLRLLNASHSAIAYTGLLAGKKTVDQVMAEPQLRVFIEQLMARELVPALAAPAGFDLPNYCEALQARFSNPCLQHRCAQIAMDGSEKVSQRWLPSLSAVPDDGLLVKALSCWVYFILESDHTIADPRAEQLLALRDSTAPLLNRVQGVLACARIAATNAPKFDSLCEQISRDLSLLAAGGVTALFADVGALCVARQQP